MLRAGRRSGKSVIGAHAVREELLVPGSIWWVCGPTFKILHDATMPTLLRLIPPSWVKNWSEDHLELTLTNNSMVQFRSLDDPERARGQGLHGVWLDEAAFIVSRAWDVLEPSLAENAGIALATTSPAGFDWSYHTFMKQALIQKRPGYWARRFKTIDNPRFALEPQLVAEIENARATKSPEVFAAEYEGEDINFTGAIYGTHADTQYVADKESMKLLIPEWPDISSNRQVIIGLDSGADHPFGAVMIVVTEAGLVIVNEYLERMQALTTHLSAIQKKFGTARFANIRWASNKNEAQLRLEFGLRGVGVVPAENKHNIGIQRVQSWLMTKQLFFAYTCPGVVEQFRAYRWAENYGTDGQKKKEEDVFKLNDEYPDCVRYAVMSWPELPKVTQELLSDAERKRWESFDDRTKADVMAVRAYNKKSKEPDMEPMEDGYPLGDFFNAYEVPWGF